MSKIKLRYPTSWDMVTLDNLSVIADVIDSMLSRREMLTVLFLRLTGCCRIEGYDCRLMKDDIIFDLPLESLAKACEELSFILDSVGLPAQSPIDVNRKMYQVRFGDWYYADALISRYEATGDKEHIRQALSKLGCQYRLTDNNIRMLLIYWHGLSAYMRERYPHVFREGDGEQAASPADMLTGLLDMVTDHHPGDNEKILNAEVHAVLSAINNKIEDYANCNRH